jgi:hypothetical protein
VADLAEKLTNRERALWGIVGGVIAVGSKYLAQDHYWLRVFLDTREYDHIYGLAVSYLVMLVILCLIGAALTIASGENKRMNLLAIAVAAPAIVTTWLGGDRADTFTSRKKISEWTTPVTVAQAADTERFNWGSSSGFWEGFKIPFGIGKDKQRYRVIAGSYKNPVEAARKAEQITRMAPELEAFVGERQPNNEYYPVVIDGYQLYPDASALKDRVNKLLSIDDAYLSPYPFR